MATYNILKTSNGEYKEINKKYKLNVSRYVGDANTLYFDGEDKDNPFLVDYQYFFGIIYDQINKGLIESLNLKDGILHVVSRDGSIIKDYTYDFSLNGFYNNGNKLDTLKRSLFKIESLYKENPNSSITTEQQYTRLIYDIIDGDRIPTITDKDELLRIFQVFNNNKKRFLNTLLDNIIFYDDNGNIIEYKKRLKEQMINSVRYDVLSQMNAAMAIFAAKNDASELYQEYLDNIYIPRREIVFKYFDEDGNEIEPPEVEGGTILNIIGMKINNAVGIVKTNTNKLLDKADDVLERIRRK